MKATETKTIDLDKSDIVNMLKEKFGQDIQVTFEMSYDTSEEYGCLPPIIFKGIKVVINK